MSSTALETAVRLLKSTAKTRAKLEQALLARGHAVADVAAAVQRVTELGYLDDARYAEAKARAAFAEGRALADVQRRLEADGIAPQLATDATRAAAEEAGHDEVSSAKALLKKKRVTGARAARLLASRGFSEDVIEKLVDLSSAAE